MCLVLAPRTPLQYADNDMEIYKFLEMYHIECDGEETICYKSPYMYHPYALGVTYDTPLGIRSFSYKECYDGDLDICGFDDIDCQYVDSQEWGWEDAEYVLFGIHAATKPERLSRHLDGAVYHKKRCIAKFIVPKGTAYFLGVTDLIVAKTAIFHSIVAEEIRKQPTQEFILVPDDELAF